MRLAFSFLLPLLAVGCQRAPEPGCDTAATVRNLTGLDGCGYVLELADGHRLEPHSKLWDAYAKRDGAQVVIGYASAPAASICMVGQGVTLTCIQPKP